MNTEEVVVRQLLNGIKLRLEGSGLWLEGKEAQ